jgi:hypothetical protein
MDLLLLNLVVDDAQVAVQDDEVALDDYELVV